MVKILTCIIFFCTTISFLLFGTTFASDCNITSEWNAVDFLTQCSQWEASENAIWITQWSTGSAGIKEKILLIVNWFLRFGALFAVWAVVFAWVQYTTSYWDDEKVKKAKTTWTYALTGLLIILISFPMVDIIVNFIYMTVGNN